MSFTDEQTISCSRCGHKETFRTWSSINVTEHPALKQELLTQELTTFRCSRCGHEAHVAFDLLYHDMEMRIAFWLKYQDDGGASGVDPLARNLFAAITDEYKCGEGDDVVEATYPWRETIQTAESVLSKLTLNRLQDSRDWRHVNRDFILHQLERAGLMRRPS